MRRPGGPAGADGRRRTCGRPHAVAVMDSSEPAGTCRALQLGRIHLRVFPDHGPGLLRDRAVQPPAGRRLADARIAFLLRLVEPALRGPAARVDSVQLRERLPACAAGRQRSAGPGKTAARRRRHREPCAVGLLQIREFLCRRRERRHGQRDPARARRSAARHLLLHLYPDRVPRRRLSRTTPGNTTRSTTDCSSRISRT